MSKFHKPSPLTGTSFICVQNLLYSSGKPLYIYNQGKLDATLTENVLFILRMPLFKSLDIFKMLLQQTSLSYKYGSIKDVQYISLNQFLTYLPEKHQA